MGHTELIIAHLGEWIKSAALPEWIRLHEIKNQTTTKNANCRPVPMVRPLHDRDTDSTDLSLSKHSSFFV